MPHYKDIENKLHFIDDLSFAYLLPSGAIEITDDEAQEIAASQVVKTIPSTDELLSALTVTVSSGKVFYADPLSRVDISNAIQLAQLQGIASTTCKLAEEFEGSKFSTVGIDELIEALYLSLSEKAKIVGASNETGY